MKCLVLYCSMTGGTRKLADAISDALNCELYNLKTAAPGTIDLSNVEGLFIGSGVYGGTFHRRITELTQNGDFIKALKDNIKILGLFSTYANSPESSEIAGRKFEELLPIEMSDNVEKYYCKGGLFGVFGRNRPVFEDVNSCKSWAKKITE